MTSGGIIVVDTATGAGGYVTEIAVPWQTLDLSPTPNTAYCLLPGDNDRDLDEPAQSDWLGLIESGSYGRPNPWGDVVLSAQACSD